MLNDSFNTIQLHTCIDRWRAGEPQAADELCHIVAGRMEHLARKLLRGSTSVRCLADTEDLQQNGMIRLWKSLQELRPASTRDFFNLAATQLRRELIDLTRRARARPDVRQRVGVNGPDESGDGMARMEETGSAGKNLDSWTRFHEAVEQLPVDQREVVGLVFYHGWTQAQIAELFQCDERTVRRRWKEASLQLAILLGGEIPSLG